MKSKIIFWLFNIFDLFLSPWIRMIPNPDPDPEDPWIQIRIRNSLSLVAEKTTGFRLPVLKYKQVHRQIS